MLTYSVIGRIFAAYGRVNFLCLHSYLEKKNVDEKKLFTFLPSCHLNLYNKYCAREQQVQTVLLLALSVGSAENDHLIDLHQDWGTLE